MKNRDEKVSEVLAIIRGLVEFARFVSFGNGGIIGIPAAFSCVEN